MKEFKGPVLFLDRSDINTDEIIPARYLTESTKEALAPYLLEDLKLPGFDPVTGTSGKKAVVTRANFGCGSSREHAPWALEVNGINLVIAKNYARIFRQNMFNCGMMAVELPAAVIDKLFAAYAGKDAIVSADIDSMKLVFEAEGKKEEIPFTISEFDKRLVRSGGWVNYADEHY